MKDRSSPLFILVAVITAITALYVAKSILLPLALAILLTFLLAPLADRLERWRIPRIPAVLGVVATSFALLGFLGGVVTNQLVQLGREFPKHQTELIRKLRSLRPESPALEKITKTLSDIRNAVTQDESQDGATNPNAQGDVAAPGSSATTETTTAETNAKTTESDLKPDEPRPSLADLTGQPPASEKAKPFEFTVSERPSTRLEQIQDVAGRIFGPIASGGLVLVLVLFLLLDRENQRSRIIQLFGRSHMHTTTQAMHDVAGRVGLYLRTLFLLNAGYGLAVAVGLWVIGVPGAIMWGVLGFSLRFLPYVGPWIAASLPIVVSIAMSPGWTQPLLVVGWYVVIELISNNIVEPLVFGSMTGVSAVGVILSAIFWTWLWGPIGLILSMPMTVCLLVAARYIPQLNFLTIVLADRPPLSPAERVYQRLLAFDYREPLKLAHKQLKDSSLVKFYDDVLLPALALAEHDRHSELLNEEQAAFVLEATEDMISDLGDTALGEQEQRRVDDVERNEAAGGDVVEGPAIAQARVLCIPLRDEADEMAARMLAQLLTAEGFQAHFGAAESLTGEMVDQVAESEADIVVISVLPPIAPRDSRLLWRRLRNRYPHLPIVVGFWTAESEKEALAAPVEDSASRVVTTLAEAAAVVRSMAAQIVVSAKTA